MDDLLVVGNGYEAENDFQKQWIFGYFMPEGCLRHQDDVEVKWSATKAGYKRPSITQEETFTTLIILIRGKIKNTFFRGNKMREVVLSKEGDYSLSLPGLRHTWEILEDSLAVVVRWPSKR